MIRRILRIEWSPTRHGFFEILGCGHLGKKKRDIFLGSKPINGRPAFQRKCKECVK